MRVVVALGGNALLRRGEAMTPGNQKINVKSAAASLQGIVADHDVVITHGNGPQVGLLALQNNFPLHILDAETEGMIGYLIEEELGNLLPSEHEIATLITRIEVDPRDPAFNNPTKPIGPLYRKDDVDNIPNERGWDFAPDGNGFRRVVPSPRPLRVLEMKVIAMLVNQGVTLICAGGGGVPTVLNEKGNYEGIDAVIDKDLASSLIARELKADALIILTDVGGVYENWGNSESKLIKKITPDALQKYSFEAGSMGPKIEAAIEFAEKSGGFAAIGNIEDAVAVLKGEAGTFISHDVKEMEFWN